MNWNSLFELLKDLGIFGFIVWGVQRVINNSADKKMEVFKSEIELKAKNFQYALDIQRDKLQQGIEEIKYKNTKLHDKQAEAITSIYKMLVQLNTSIRAFISPRYVPIDEQQQQEEERKQLSDIKDEFDTLSHNFESNRILFSEDMCTSIEALLEEFKTKMLDYLSPKFLKNMGMLPQQLKDDNLKAYDAAKHIRNIIPGKLRELENEFRRLLNVN